MSGIDNGSRVSVAFDRSLFSGDAIQRAAYRMAHRFSVEVTVSADSYECGLDSIVGVGVSDEDVALFRVHVNDYTLRERIRAETEATRNVILALAFSNLQLGHEG